LKPPTPLVPFVAETLLAQTEPPPPLKPVADGDPTAFTATDAPPLPPLAVIAVPEPGVNEVVPPLPPGVALAVD
jgi:hypothetical protein